MMQRAVRISLFAAFILVSFAYSASYEDMKAAYHKQFNGVTLSQQEKQLATEFHRLYMLPEAASNELDEQGGPDDGGYTYIDSQEEGGPTYNWIDISETGTQITGVTDEGQQGPFDIGFNFPYYGDIFDEFWFQPNGNISFDGIAPGATGYQMPSAYGGAMISYFWDDLNASDGGTFYYETTTINEQTALVISAIDFCEYETDGYFTVQIILFEDGTILLQYAAFENHMDITLASIGTQNSDRSCGLSILFQNDVPNYPFPELAIQIDPPVPDASLSGTITDDHTGAALEGATVTFQGMTTTTDRDGNFSFRDLYSGISGTIEVNRFEYTLLITEEIELSVGENTQNLGLEAWPDDKRIYFEQVDYSWQEVSENATALNIDDDDSELLTFADYGLGNFTWYGTEYSSVYVISNGRFCFTDGDIDGTPYAFVMPYPTEPNANISVLGTDLDPSDGGTIYAEVVDGDLVVTWDEVVYYDQLNAANTFQAIFDFTTLDVTANYNTIAADEDEDMNVSIGFEDENGTVGVQFYYGPDDNNPIGRGQVSARVYLDRTTANLRGTVTDANSNPLEGATLTLTPDEGDAITATSDASGHYVFAELEPGTYDLEATLEGYFANTVEDLSFEANDFAVQNITLSPSVANLSGTVTDPDDNPLEGVSLILTPETGDALNTTTDASGNFEFAMLAPSSYNLEAILDGYVTGTVENFTLAAGDVVAQEITLVPNIANLRGTVTATNSDPLEGVTVTLTPNEGDALTTTTDAAGTYYFRDFLPGTYDLTATLEGYVPHALNDITFQANVPETYEFALAPIGTYTIENVQTTVETDTWVTITGIVTLQTNSIHTDRFDCYIQDASGYGVMLYDSEPLNPENNLVRGDEVQVTGQVAEYNGITEIVNFTVEMLSSGNNLPAPITGTTAEIAALSAMEGAWTMVMGELQGDPGTESYTLSIDDGSGAVTVYINEDAGLDLSGFAAEDWIVFYGPISLYRDAVQIIPSLAEDFHAPILETPTEMAATRENGSPMVELSWAFADAETDEFIEFILYRNGEVLTETENLVYTDDLTGIAAGTFEYWVVASFDEGMSANSDTASVEWDGVGVEENLFSQVPTEYSIARAYPNPFNPTMTAVVGLPNAADLDVRVFNILGEQVSVLAQGRFAQGYHSFTFNATNLSSGLYFIQAYVPGKMNAVHKVTLVR